MATSLMPDIRPLLQATLRPTAHRKPQPCSCRRRTYSVFVEERGRFGCQRVISTRPAFHLQQTIPQKQGISFDKSSLFSPIFHNHFNNLRFTVPYSRFYMLLSN
jgi:hypothetical protein